MREMAWVVVLAGEGLSTDRVRALPLVLEDGALVFRNQDGQVVRAFALGAWARVRAEEPKQEETK